MIDAIKKYTIISLSSAALTEFVIFLVMFGFSGCGYVVLSVSKRQSIFRLYLDCLCEYRQRICYFDSGITEGMQMFTICFLRILNKEMFSWRAYGHLSE